MSGGATLNTSLLSSSLPASHPSSFRQPAPAATPWTPSPATHVPLGARRPGGSPAFTPIRSVGSAPRIGRTAASSSSIAYPSSRAATAIPGQRGRVVGRTGGSWPELPAAAAAPPWPEVRALAGSVSIPSLVARPPMLGSVSKPTCTSHSPVARGAVRFAARKGVSLGAGRDELREVAARAWGGATMVHAT